MAFGVGPIIRIIAQAIPVVMRAIPAAYAKAIQNARKEGGAATAANATAGKTATDLFRTPPMTKDEALQILNLEESDLNQIITQQQQSQSSSTTDNSNNNNNNNIILERFEKYMNINEVKKVPNTSYNTGSFYLQSKIYNAKETLLRELKNAKQSPPSESQ